MKKTFSFASLFTVLLLVISNTPAMACAACWNPAGSDKMTHAATVGIFAMLVIMLAMLGTIIGVGFHLAWRAKNPLPDYQELLGDDGAQPSPGASA
jgi:uncharacterized membrane protein